MSLITALAGICALWFARGRVNWIRQQDAGSDRVQQVGRWIHEGAMAFMARQYRIVLRFVAVVAALLVIGGFVVAQSSFLIAFAFAVGAACAGLASYSGVSIATEANGRAATAAAGGVAGAMQVAFAGGTVAGVSAVALGIVGLSVLYMFLGLVLEGPLRVLSGLSGFLLGGSTVALLTRVGGGTFTKAADVAADLVGKLERDLPEDDARNPAVIADQVGDNVGGIAGATADLFESHAGAIVAAMTLGAMYAEWRLVVLPLVLATLGVGASILGSTRVRPAEKGRPHAILRTGSLVAGASMLLLAYPVTKLLVPGSVGVDGSEALARLTAGGIYLATVVGLIAGFVVAYAAEVYTAESRTTARRLAEQAQTGVGPTLIAGLGVGMLSTAWPVLALAAVIVIAFAAAGPFGIAVAAVGLLSTTGIQLALDAYGSIADNARGIAEISRLGAGVRERTETLDASGITTAGARSFVTASATLTALALLAAFQMTAGLVVIDVGDPAVLAGILGGAMLPFVFTALTLRGVGEAASAMIEEIRRQLETLPGVMDGTARPDYARCVGIATSVALRRMVLLVAFALVVPAAVGLVDKQALAGVLVGALVSGALLSLAMGNAGQAWSNARKHVEGGAFGGKQSEAHGGSVVGDAFGDPLKDAVAPALNVLIKLLAAVALVIAPLIR